MNSQDSDGYAKIKRRKALMRFKALVRRVIENIGWLKTEETHIFDDFDLPPKPPKTANADTISECLDFETRVALMQKPENRTEEQLEKIIALLSVIKEFRRFQFDLPGIAKYIEYQVVGNDRMILRQGRQAEFFYVVLAGVVEVSAEKVPINNPFFPFSYNKAQLHIGGMFGDFSMIVNQPRSNTVTAMHSVELLVASRQVFDTFFRDTLQAHYQIVNKAIKGLSYFENFERSVLDEISFQGQLKIYKEGDLIYSSKSMREVTFFVIDGDCDLIELIRVTRNLNSEGKEVFLPYQPGSIQFLSTRSESRNPKMAINTKMLDLLKKHVKRHSEKPKRYQVFSAKQWQPKYNTRHSYQSASATSQRPEPMDRIPSMPFSRRISNRLINFTSVDGSGSNVISNKSNTSTNEPKKTREESYGFRSRLQTSLGNCLMHLDSEAIDRFITRERMSPLFETHFMAVATYIRGACCNVGENLMNRFIVAATPTVILEVPKKVLARQRSIVWEKVRLLLDRKIPNNAMVFSKFIKDRMYREWKRELFASMLTPKDLAKSGNRINNVPYSIRIRHDMDFNDEYQRATISDKLFRHVYFP